MDEFLKYTNICYVILKRLHELNRLIHTNCQEYVPSTGASIKSTSIVLLLFFFGESLLDDFRFLLLALVLPLPGMQSQSIAFARILNNMLQNHKTVFIRVQTISLKCKGLWCPSMSWDTVSNVKYKVEYPFSGPSFLRLFYFGWHWQKQQRLAVLIFFVWAQESLYRFHRCYVHFYVLFLWTWFGDKRSG